MLKTDFISSSFVGFDNFIHTFTDPVFMRSWLNSFGYTIFMAGVAPLIALVISLTVFTLPKRWHDISRIIFWVPSLAAGIIIAQTWRWIYHAQGPINWLFGKLGFESIRFFAQGYTAIPAIAIVVVFASLGASTMMILSSILAIDGSIYEAAKIDGATWFQIKTRIIIPLLKPIIALMSLVGMIASFQVFETIYALAPYEYAATVTYHVYQQAFIFGKYGLASAQAIILLIVIVILTILKKRVEGETT